MAQTFAPIARSAPSAAFELRQGLTHIPLTAAPDDARSLASRIGGLGASRQIYLVLSNLEIDEPSGATFNVLLDRRPSLAPRGPADPAYVGTLNFFNAFGPDRQASFNVTERVKQIVTDGTADLTITIASAGELPKRSRPKIGKAELVVGRDAN